MAANRDPSYLNYYPKNWPATPFHHGEVELQKAAGVHDAVMSYAPRVIRPYLPEQHRTFYQSQPFLVIAADDADGQRWSTLLMGGPSMTDSPSPIALSMDAHPVPGDALDGALRVGSDVGILGIELATKRRNRVNGRIVGRTTGRLDFQVDQAFGNCPQYIVQRPSWYWVEAQAPPAVRSDRLDEHQMAKVRSATTAFVATGYRGAGDDVRFGMDASHRGGPVGMLLVEDDRTIVLPDFAGNNHFNTLGNLRLDDRMGLTVPDLENGGLLQISGNATVDLDADRAAATYPGAQRLVTLHITAVNELPAGSLPLRFSATVPERTLQIAKIVQESLDVKSFYLESAEPLWPFQAGQHLPIRLQTAAGELMRTYSLSSAESNKYYRISVKKQGKASRFLHGLGVGATILAQPPAGDFVLDNNSTRNGPVVLLSAGIGVTPIFSMLEELVRTKSQRRRLVWMQAARNGAEHPFRQQVSELIQGNTAVQSHIVYSKPRGDDHSFDSAGRINADLIRSLVDDWESAEYYMCGPGSFLVTAQEGLLQFGVGFDQIHYEIF